MLRHRHHTIPATNNALKLHEHGLVTLVLVKLREDEILSILIRLPRICAIALHPVRRRIAIRSLWLLKVVLRAILCLLRHLCPILPLVTILLIWIHFRGCEQDTPRARLRLEHHFDGVKEQNIEQRMPDSPVAGQASHSGTMHYVMRQ